jgi:hypothetical protein
MADTKIKITEVQTTETVKPDAYTLITQEDDNEVETLYRAHIAQSVKPMFYIELYSDNRVGFADAATKAAFEALLAKIYQDNQSYGSVSGCNASKYVDLFLEVQTDYGAFVKPGWIETLTDRKATICVNLGKTTAVSPARLHDVIFSYGYGADAGVYTFTDRMYTLTPAT